MSYEIYSIAVVTNFAHYTQGRGLPTELFHSPDYISLQAGDISDFSQMVKEAEPKAEQITVAEAEDRFIASVRLAGGLGIANLGRVRWLEIQEPTEAEMWTGLGSDRIGLYYADLEKARSILGNRGVPHTITENPAPTIIVPYTETGVNGEFALSKLPLGALVEEDIQADKVTFVKRAA